MEKQEIIEGDWDNLIILDACRYDIFEEVCDMEGDLEKRLSRGSCTAEWLARSFTKPVDVVYYSANPFVNNLNMPLRKTVTDSTVRMHNLDWNWNPTEHFKEVKDVWDIKWSDKYNTVTPWGLKDYILSNMEIGNKRIIHFDQPHQPYLHYKDTNKEWQNKYRAKGQEYTKPIVDKRINIIKPLVKPILKITPKKRQWQIKKILGGNLSVIQKIVVGDGKGKLVKLYKKNLQSALNSVEKLTKELDGKTIITADHGEAFGENGDWAHKYNSKNPVLRQVPWLEVEA